MREERGMKAYITKLRSRRGASLILAAVYFLICAFVGGTVLGAATSGSAHLKDRKAEEQAFQIQRSAAQVIRDQLTVETGYLQAEISKSEEIYTLTPASESPVDLQTLVRQGAAARYGEKKEITAFNEYTTEGELVLAMTTNEDMESESAKSDTVDVHYEVGENYDVTVSVSVGGVSRMYVFMKASVAERDDVTTVTWGAPVLRKAGEAA